jgi:hypothetical protein
MSVRYTPRCTRCNRFVPEAFLAIVNVGDYGGEPAEDFTLCRPCGGPVCESEAFRVEHERETASPINARGGR